MSKRKIAYTKRATTYDDQINLLKQRGVLISDEGEAKEYLSDIGYYRLGFYLHPFEITYPSLDSRRKHQLKPGTKIEVAIRTTVIYELSNKYINNPMWFVDPNIVSPMFISDFHSTAYNSIKKKGPIKRHHQKYTGQYAPAWKTMEYMTLGNIEALYDSLLSDSDKRIISTHFGEPATATFKTYMMAVREVRNACAHGNVLYELTLTSGIRSGVACPSFPANTQQTFHGALRVIDYLLKKISVNRAKDMWDGIYEATRLLFSQSPGLQPLIEVRTGIVLPENLP